MDNLTKEKRSWNMSRIKGKNTKPELLLRSYLFKQGFRYRKHFSIAGKPDIVFPKQKISIFIHGCFWHGHGCKNSTIPKTNTAFWKRKLNGNIKRDKFVYTKLVKSGWRVIIIWECEIEKDISKVVKKLKKYIEERNVN